MIFKSYHLKMVGGPESPPKRGPPKGPPARLTTMWLWVKAKGIPFWGS